MITKFKIFESVNNPKVGDYVLIDMNKNMFPIIDSDQRIYTDFIRNTIGRITNVNNVHNNISVEYQDIPNQIRYLFNKQNVLYTPSRIKILGKTPEEVELQIKSKNYNL